MTKFSLKSKLTLAVCLLVAAVLIGSATFVFLYFQGTMRTAIVHHQDVLVSVLAEEIDGKLRRAENHLAAISREITPDLLSDRAKIKKFFASQKDNQTLFDRGLFLLSPTGEVLTSAGFAPLDASRSSLVEARMRIRAGREKPHILSPICFLSKDSPSVALFAVAIPAPGRKVAGILVGGLNMLGENFFGGLAHSQLGQGGALYLINRQRSLLLRPASVPLVKDVVRTGKNQLFAAVRKGFAGTEKIVTPGGMAVLASVKPLQTAGWTLAVNSPASEAFASIETARRNLLIGLFAVLLLTSGILWLLMGHLMKPLEVLTRHVRAVEESEETPPTIDLDSMGEIGALARAFNQMLVKVVANRRALGEQLHFLQVLINAIPNPIFFKDAEGRYLGCNRAFEGYIGIPLEELVGKSVFEIAPEEFAEVYFRADNELFIQGVDKTQVYESSVRYADGTPHDVIFYKATFPGPDGRLGGLVGTILDITERKQAEAALEEQKRFSENLLLNAAVPGFVLDADHRVVAWNRACEGLTGIPAAEVLGTDEHWRAFFARRRFCLADFVIEGNFDEMASWYDNYGCSNLVPGGWLAEGWLTLNGHRRYLVFNAAPILNRQGEIVAAIETMEDITARRQAEEDLAHSLSLLQATLESTVDGILVVDRKGNLISFNQKFLDLWRVPDKILTSGKDQPLLKHGLQQMADPKAFLARIRELYRHPGMEGGDTLRLKDGRVYQHFSRPQRLGEQVVGRVWSFRDVTRQEQMVDQLRKLSRAVEQSPNAVVVTDVQGTIEYVNPRFTESSGYAFEESVGKNPRFLKAGDIPEEYYKTLWETITAGREWRGEFHNKKKNGELFWERALISPIRGQAGNISHFVALKEDITEQKEVERRHQMTTQVLSLLSLPGEKTDRIRDILQLIKDFSGSDAVAIRLREKGDFPYYRTIGLDDDFIAAENLLGSEIPGEEMSHCLCGKVLLGKAYLDFPGFTEGGSFWTNDALGEDLEPGDREGALCSRSPCRTEGFRSMAMVPLRSGESTIGLLQLLDRRAGRFSADLIRFLERIGGSIGIAFEHRQTQEKLLEREDRLHFLTNYDSLTHLPNRVLLQDRLQHAVAKAKRTGKTLALLILDIDRFKTVNDSIGHEAGDRLLVEMADRLREFVREVDTLARFSGDEFAILLEEVEDLKKVVLIARKALSQFSWGVDLEGYQLFLTASIGISIFPTDAEDPETLLKYAEMAMYRAKELGRNNYQFYLPEMNVSSRGLLLLENSLRQALEKRQMPIYYQPKIDLATGRMVGAEALVRWQHPELGMVPPSDFIPLAEETGLIVPIGEWVLRTACAQGRVWQFRGQSPLRVAVNVSGRQFRQAGFAERVAQILQETGLAPDLLELEITESVVMDNVETTIRTLTSLKEKGIRLAIDDFGTGYSSLSYLKRFPIDCLKIDRVFVREVTSDANDAAIASSVVALAQAMKLTVVAEGVDTEEQLAFFRQIGCGQVQGFLFSQPVPAPSFEKFFDRDDWLAEFSAGDGPDRPI